MKGFRHIAGKGVDQLYAIKAFASIKVRPMLRWHACNQHINAQRADGLPVPQKIVVLVLKDRDLQAFELAERPDKSGRKGFSRCEYRSEQRRVGRASSSMCGA